MDLTIDAVEEPVIMRGENKSRAPLLINAAHQIDDQVRVVGIEIRGRFIGDDECGIGHESPGDRDTLLLAATHFLGTVVHAVREFDLAQQLFGPRSCIGLGNAADLQGKHHVLERGENGDEIEILEDKPDRGAAQFTSASISEAGSRRARDEDFSRGRGVK